ncbi:hypothetical protein COS75_02175 [Candidatus Pacearchaeota archaeon CG06_land_8_20_14_3_00_35_12]|nr:MAG: hypothetical protein COS75_02175 [Candidatus Pacearchaeota archaeon CG06_land_8_20_14_3_00_35_12]
MTENKKDKIYLAGSFYSFRDRIINALPEHDFADPRKHRQFAIAPLVIDDMKEAEESPIFLACFPKGKTRGTMTYGEIGASKILGNYVMIADENEQKDPLLEQIADVNFNSIDAAIDFLRSNNKILKSEYEKTPKKESLDKIETIFLASNSRNFPEIFELNKKGMNIVTPENITSLNEFKNADLNAVYFPSMGDWERKAIFFMGAAYALEMPTIMLDEKEFSYPPLNGIVRRVCRSKISMMDYMSTLIDRKTQKIEVEAGICYDFFKKYDHIDK